MIVFQGVFILEIGVCPGLFFQNPCSATELLGGEFFEKPQFMGELELQVVDGWTYPRNVLRIVYNYIYRHIYIFIYIYRESMQYA